ncbi:PDZD4 protein, partial [Acromyrmex charruanus]
MCQPLPYTEFRWIEDAANFDVSAIAPDSPTGYILEVELEYPQHLHDQHTDLSFCPTRDKLPDKRKDKLLATLYDKKRYVIHYRNPQQCTRHDLRVIKIHRVLQFAQFPWFCDYIELNTQFRTLAKNDFEKNLYKLMNNVVFGKTMENVRNHVDVKLITKWDEWFSAEAMIAKPNFHSRSVFAENLITVEMVGRYWSKEERKRQLERERKQRQQELILQQEQQQIQQTKDLVIWEHTEDKVSKKPLNIVELSYKKMVRKKTLDDFTTVQEMLVHGNRVGTGGSSMGGKLMGLLSVTTV